ncbi:hypothetical protein ACFVSN_09120 [Kitasatospora sp. NPDC057904]|uniref:hypothetical protein n=1 Tax=Kitasatospora sp. NPDC057904 TaxID=3346275 RepID=UPI0036DE0B0C
MGVPQFVFDLLVFALPAGDVGGAAFEDAVRDGLFEDAGERGEGVLDRGAAAAVGDPAEDCGSDESGGDQAEGEPPELGLDPQVPELAPL